MIDSCMLNNVHSQQVCLTVQLTFSYQTSAETAECVSLVIGDMKAYFQFWCQEAPGSNISVV